MNVSKIYPLSETAIVVEWGDGINDTQHQQVLDLDYSLHQTPFEGLLETVPAYVSLTIYYQPEEITLQNSTPFLWVKNYIETLLQQAAGGFSAAKNVVSIPVCYDPELGYDLDFVAATHGISKEKVIEIHQQKEYKVYMMGFLPGFAYLGTLDEAIATPRKPTPRAKVEAGSVGIAGNQTGIYPLASPGGWQIIGRTPWSMFDLTKANPFRLKTGDSVKFQAITKEAFYEAENIEKVPEPQKTADFIEVEVIKPGIYATIQDLGRFGFRAYGVPLSGAMDIVAHNMANALVGNTQQAATIECTMGGMALLFKKEALIALTGGGAAFINDISIELHQSYSVNENDVLTIRFNQKGIRTYLAARGGFEAEPIMNSKSICPMIGIGMPLAKGLGLRFGKDFSTAPKKLAEDSPLSAFVARKIGSVQESVAHLENHINLGVPHFSEHSRKIIRVCQGPEFNWMTAKSASQFYNQQFTLSNRCDRMGYHLLGEPLLKSHPLELISTAVAIGTIQLTPNGQLIVLMSDCQTTGGYPRVGQIAAVDLPIVAQLIPGETITFEPISFTEAEALYIIQQKAIHALFN